MKGGSCPLSEGRLRRAHSHQGDAVRAPQDSGSALSLRARDPRSQHRPKLRGVGSSGAPLRGSPQPGRGSAPLCGGPGGFARGYSLKARFSVGDALKTYLDLCLALSPATSHPHCLKAAAPMVAVTTQLCEAAVSYIWPGSWGREGGCKGSAFGIVWV